MNRHDLGAGQGRADLLHHFLHRAGRAQGGHFHQGHAPRHVEHRLGARQGGKEQLVVLGARGLNETRHRHGSAGDGQGVPHRQAQDPGRLGPCQETVGLRPASVDFPPGLQNAGFFEIHPRQHDGPFVDPHGPQGHRPHGRNVAGVLDVLHGGQVGFTQLLHVKRNAAHLNAAVAQGQAFGAGHDEDIGPVFFKLVVDVLRDRIGKADHRDHRADAQHQPQQDQQSLALAPQEILDRNLF